MEIAVQGLKRQKCFVLNANDGVPEHAPQFTLEEQQSFAISQLELWKQCDDVNASTYDAAAVRDSNHTKLLQYQDRTLPVKGDASNGNEKKAEKMKKAIESATKAAAELSMLVQLTTLIQSNKILSLQTFYSGASLPVHGDVDAESAATKPAETLRDLWNLPIAQRIDIQRQTFTKAKSTLLSGLERCKALVAERQSFADTIARCQEERDFRLCCVDSRTGRRVVRRTYDAKKDFIAIDCSVTIASTGMEVKTNVSTASGSAVGKRPASVSGAASVASAESSTDAYTKTAFVPIAMGKNGVELAPGEKEAPVRTLQIQLLWNKHRGRQPVNHSQGAITLPTATHADFTVLCGNRAWDLLHPDVHAQRQTMTTPDAVAEVTDYCQRRHHETLCHVLFERLQRECADGATDWGVLTALPGEVRAGAGAGAGAGLSEKDVRQLHKVLAEERVGRGITVLSSTEDRLVLRLSDALLLVLAMQPIDAVDTSAENGEAGAMDVVDSSAVGGSAVVAAEARALQQGASRALLGALLHLLRGPASSPDSVDAGALALVAEGGSGAEAYWRRLARSTQDAKAGAGKNVLVQQVLQTVRDSVQEVRGMHVRR